MEKWVVYVNGSDEGCFDDGRDERCMTDVVVERSDRTYVVNDRGERGYFV